MTISGNNLVIVIIIKKYNHYNYKKGETTCIESISVPGHFTSYVQGHACATPKKNGIK
jgi:hypothetical protein